METHTLVIDGIPALLWGKDSPQICLYVHGQHGSKEEASLLAEILCPAGWQVLSFDLPGHGERQAEQDAFVPWHIVPELDSILRYAKNRWKCRALFANSIGAWFSLLAFPQERFVECLFVSPVVDMKQLIRKMMDWAHVSEEQLKQQGRIPTTFGQTLDWEYWQYTLAHPLLRWPSPTCILYGEKDHLVDFSEVEAFSRRFSCRVTVMKQGEHWFHTEAQRAYLKGWVQKHLPPETSSR